MSDVNQKYIITYAIKHFHIDVVFIPDINTYIDIYLGSKDDSKNPSCISCIYLLYEKKTNIKHFRNQSKVTVK